MAEGKIDERGIYRHAYECALQYGGACDCRPRASASVSSQETRKPVTLLESRAIALAGLERAERLRDEANLPPSAPADEQLADIARCFGSPEAPCEASADAIIREIVALRAEVASLSSSLSEARADNPECEHCGHGAGAHSDGLCNRCETFDGPCRAARWARMSATTRAEDATPE